MCGDRGFTRSLDKIIETSRTTDDPDRHDANGRAASVVARRYPRGITHLMKFPKRFHAGMNAFPAVQHFTADTGVLDAAAVGNDCARDRTGNYERRWRLRIRADADRSSAADSEVANREQAEGDEPGRAASQTARWNTYDAATLSVPRPPPARAAVSARGYGTRSAYAQPPVTAGGPAGPPLRIATIVVFGGSSRASR